MANNNNNNNRGGRGRRGGGAARGGRAAPAGGLVQNLLGQIANLQAQLAVPAGGGPANPPAPVVPVPTPARVVIAPGPWRRGNLVVKLMVWARDSSVAWSAILGSLLATIDLLVAYYQGRRFRQNPPHPVFSSLWFKALGQLMWKCFFRSILVSFLPQVFRMIGFLYCLWDEWMNSGLRQPTRTRVSVAAIPVLPVPAVEDRCENDTTRPLIAHDITRLVPQLEVTEDQMNGAPDITRPVTLLEAVRTDPQTVLAMWYHQLLPHQWPARRLYSPAIDRQATTRQTTFQKADVVRVLSRDDRVSLAHQALVEEGRSLPDDMVWILNWRRASLAWTGKEFPGPDPPSLSF